MKTLRSAVQICLLFLCLLPVSGLASATTLTLSGNILFSSLDGAAQDSDGLANGVFTVNGDLDLAGTINCNDDPPLPGNASACPIRIAVTGDLTMEAGSGIFAENRSGGGHGGDIRLDVGGDLALEGPGSGLPGAVVSSSRLSNGSSWRAGNITILVGGGVGLQEGTALAASTPGGTAGTIAITAEGAIQAAGLIVSGPSRTVLSSRWTGLILGGGASGQSGGPISLRSHTTAEPAIRIDSGAIVASQGEEGGGRLVLLEACGIEVRGLVASISKQGGPSLVAIRSGKGILVDGRDLGAAGSRLGRIRADGSLGGAAGYMVDLFAQNDIQILGPGPSSAGAFAVSSSPGTQAQRPAGGTVTAISLAGSLTAAGKAFEAGRSQDGNKGGTIDLKAQSNVNLDGASLSAVGDFTSMSKNRAGGKISARSYQGAVSWTFGVGDVRPTGTGVSAANRGTITLTACTTVDTIGTQFPVTGSAIPPFPVENEGVCSPSAPVLPSGEPPLPVCNEPPVANAQAVETDEDTPVTITLTGSDPNSDPLTFTIETPPAHGSLGPLTSPTATSVQVVYTPALNYNGPDSFVFQVDDGHGGTDTATVTITINAKNDPPSADDDTYNVNEGGTLNVPAPGVLDGDTDVDSDPLTAVLNTGPAHASSFTFNPDGSFTYVHDGSETTSDSFTYHANDGSTDSNVATVTITIAAVNDPPVADDDAYNVNEGGTLNVPIPGVLDGDTDPDGDPLTAMLDSGPAHAAVFTLNPDGSFTYVHDGSETTSDAFIYHANDGSANSNLATVTIAIAAVNDPPAANPDTADITEEAPNVPAANTVAGNVLANDTDSDNSLIVSAVAGGSVGSPRAGSYGSVTINSDGSFTYTLDDSNPAVNALAPGGTLTDTFGYTASDGTLTSSSTLTVTIHGADDPPTPDDDTAEFIGNTELRVDLEAGSTPAVLATTPTTSGVLDGDMDPEGGAITISGIVGCDDVSAPFDCVLPGQGTVSLRSDGRFTFVPEAGDTDPAASFQYTLTGNPVPATVTLTRKERVWYVKNDDGGGTGVSNDPFAALAEAQTASVAGDTIYVFEGDGDTTGQDQGIILKANQRMIGEGVALDVPVSVNGGPNPTVLRDSGNRPTIDNTNAGGHAVSATDALPARIAGLSLIGSSNAIDITTNGAFSGSGSLTIANNAIDNTVRPGGAEGIDINAGGTGTVALAVHNNTLTATGTAIDIARTAGTVLITAFNDNTISGNTTGSGIVITGPVTFDSNTGAAGNQAVSGGITVIGASGNPVTGSGLVLNNVTGALDFTDLDVYAGTAGLVVQGTGGFTGATGTRITVTPASPDGSGTGTIETDNGAAIDIASATIDLRLDRLDSVTSGSGVNLSSVGGQFRAPLGSAISKTSGAGTAFSVANSVSGTTVTYAGTLNVTSGSGVSLSSNTGSTISFSGGMTLSTGPNAGFSATGGGTLTVTDPPGLTNNTVTTTTGTALTVTNTTIGASGLTFERISTNGAANGIVLNNTGASGGLTVTGNGTANSGGVIQNSTGDGISLVSTRNITLNRMRIASSGQSHIDASTVTNLTLNNIDTDTSNDHGILGSNITNLVINGGTFHRGGAGAEPTCNLNGVNITNLLGTSSVTGATFTRSNTIQFRVNNTATSGSVDTLTVSGTTWGTHTGPCSGDHLSVNADTGGNFKLVTNGSAGENNFTTGGIGIQASSGGSGTMQASITGIETSGNTAGVAIVGTATSNISFNVFNNNTANGTGFFGTGSVALILTCTTSGTCQGAFDNNSITHTAGTSTNAMQVVVEGNGTGRVTVSNNTVSGNFQRGLQGQSRSGTGSLTLHVTGNNFTATDAAGLQVMNFEVGASGGGTTNSMCLNLANNTATPAGSMPAYRLFHRTGYTYQLQNLAQASTTNTADVQTWVTTTKNNTGTPVSVTIGTSPFTTSAGCSTPSLPSP